MLDEDAVCLNNKTTEMWSIVELNCMKFLMVTRYQSALFSFLTNSFKELFFSVALLADFSAIVMATYSLLSSSKLE